VFHEDSEKSNELFYQTILLRLLFGWLIRKIAGTMAAAAIQTGMPS